MKREGPFFNNTIKNRKKMKRNRCTNCGRFSKRNEIQHSCIFPIRYSFITKERIIEHFKNIFNG